MNKMKTINTKNALFIGVFIYLLSGSVYAQMANENDGLTFKATNLEDNTGQLLVYLYRKGDDLPSKPCKVVKASITNMEASANFSGIPYGSYAAILVHDKNNNGEIDHKWGFPAEPLAYTNNWKLGLFSGMPSYEKLKFSYTEKHHSIEITFDE